MANGILLLDLEDPLAEYGQMDVNQNIPQDAQLPPSAPVRLNARGAETGEALLGFGAVEASLNLSPSGDLEEAAANLFAMLRALDKPGVTGIAVSPIPDYGLGLAINDRLKRAAFDSRAN